MKTNASDVTVIVPCRNEERTIEAIYSELSKKGYKILFPIAKSSVDRTIDICKTNNYDFFIDSGGGKGVGLRESVPRVKTKYLVFFDADGSHEISDIEPMVERLISAGADIVIGSRLLGGSMELYDGSFESFLRSFFTLCINQIVNTRFNSHVTDTQNGFRAAKTESMAKLNLKSNTFEIETEMVMKALKLKMKIEEIPSREYPRKFGQSGVSILKHGWRYIWCVLKNFF